MISPKSYEEMATYLEKPEKVVFFFTANWCPDCQFIYPVMPEIEAENPEFTFARVDRDDFMEVEQRWNIFERFCHLRFALGKCSSGRCLGELPFL